MINKFMLVVLISILYIISFTACKQMPASKQQTEKVNNKIDNLIAEGKYDKAFIEITSALDDNSADDNTKASLGWVYYYQKDYSKARKILEELVKEKPKNEEAHFSLGKVYQALKKYDEAIKEFTIVVELNPTNDKAFEVLASTYNESKNYSKAEWAYKKAIDIQPSESIYYLSLSDLYYKQEKFKPAIENCTKAYKLASADNKDRIKQTLENMKLRAILKQN